MAEDNDEIQIKVLYRVKSISYDDTLEQINHICDNVCSKRICDNCPHYLNCFLITGEYGTMPVFRIGIRDNSLLRLTGYQQQVINKIYNAVIHNELCGKKASLIGLEMLISDSYYSLSTEEKEKIQKMYDIVMQHDA